MTPREEALTVQIVAAVLEAVRLDVLASEGHSRSIVRTAIRMGKKLERDGPAWYEEPVPRQNIPAIVEVANHLDLLVGTAESLSSKQQAAELLAYSPNDIINTEPLQTGGILCSRQVVDMVEAHYGAVIPHTSPQWPVCPVACMHVDAATPNAGLQETFEDFNQPWERQLATNFPAIRQRHFDLPTGPGLSIDLDLEEVRTHPYRKNPDISPFEKNLQLRGSVSTK